MNKKHLDHFQTRRTFLCRSACASMGVGGIVNTLAHLRLISGAMAQSAPTDYKAIVCLFLFGGNDANNMLLPLDGAARANYDLARPVGNPLRIGIPGSSDPVKALAINNAFAQTTATQFGLHPSLSNTVNLFNTGELAFVSNVGTLVQPISRAEYQAGTKPVPPELFSHSDQQVQWQSSVPDKPFTSGWGGRTADLLNALDNPGSHVSMNISIAGLNSFQVGNSPLVQYSVGTDGVVSLAGYSDATGPYGKAVDGAGAYKTTDEGKTFKAFETIRNLTFDHLLEDGYNQVINRARTNEAVIGAALAADATAIDNAFTAAGANSATADQLKMVARLMLGRTALGNQRQIFFVNMNGFDTHQDQVGDQSSLLSDLDQALLAFKNAVSGIDATMWDSTLLFTHSDFARTLQPNGSDTAVGTDHGWGGHQIVMGGKVSGGNIFGAFPDLARNTGQDADSNRGRWIPTTSVEQYSSVIAKWFGVDANSITTVFPNLGRFQNPLTIPPNLNFMT